MSKATSRLSGLLGWLAARKVAIALGTLTVLAIIAYVVSLKLNLADARNQAVEAQARAEAAEASVAVQNASSEASSAAHRTKTKARLEIDRRNATDRKKLDEALAANRDWASQPVPPAVLDSLR